MPRRSVAGGNRNRRRAATPNLADGLGGLFSELAFTSTDGAARKSTSTQSLGRAGDLHSKENAGHHQANLKSTQSRNAALTSSTHRSPPSKTNASRKLQKTAQNGPGTLRVSNEWRRCSESSGGSRAIDEDSQVSSLSGRSYDEDSQSITSDGNESENSDESQSSSDACTSDSLSEKSTSDSVSEKSEETLLEEDGTSEIDEDSNDDDDYHPDDDSIGVCESVSRNGSESVCDDSAADDEELDEDLSLDEEDRSLQRRRLLAAAFQDKTSDCKEQAGDPKLVQRRETSGSMVLHSIAPPQSFHGSESVCDESAAGDEELDEDLSLDEEDRSLQRRRLLAAASRSQRTLAKNSLKDVQSTSDSQISADDVSTASTETEEDPRCVISIDSDIHSEEEVEVEDFVEAEIVVDEADGADPVFVEEVEVTTRPVAEADRWRATREDRTTSSDEADENLAEDEDKEVDYATGHEPVAGLADENCAEVEINDALPPVTIAHIERVIPGGSGFASEEADKEDENRAEATDIFGSLLSVDCCTGPALTRDELGESDASRVQGAIAANMPSTGEAVLLGQQRCVSNMSGASDESDEKGEVCYAQPSVAIPDLKQATYGVVAASANKAVESLAKEAADDSVPRVKPANREQEIQEGGAPVSTEAEQVGESPVEDAVIDDALPHEEVGDCGQATHAADAPTCEDLDKPERDLETAVVECTGPPLTVISFIRQELRNCDTPNRRTPPGYNQSYAISPLPSPNSPRSRNLEGELCDNEPRYSEKNSESSGMEFTAVFADNRALDNSRFEFENAGTSLIDRFSSGILDLATRFSSNHNASPIPADENPVITLPSARENSSSAKSNQEVNAAGLREVNFRVPSFDTATELVSADAAFRHPDDTLHPQHSCKSTNAKARENKATSQSGNAIRGSKWVLGPKIGGGAFGTVRVGMDTENGSLVAVKVIPIEGSNAKDLKTEIDLLRSLQHENIVRYLRAESEESFVYIFQEWVTGGSISSLLRKFGSFAMPVIRSYLLQMLCGLAYLHGSGVIHRDIKGSNILVSDGGIIKLADFGSSKRLGPTQRNINMSLTVRGTPYFMAPEVFESKYSQKADIWSVGCVAVQMASGRCPWESLGLDSQVLLFNYLKSTSGPPLLNRHSTESPLELDLFRRLLERCFSRDPEVRPSASDLQDDSFFRTEAKTASDDDFSVSKRSFPACETSHASTATHREISPVAGGRSPFRPRSSSVAQSRPLPLSPPLPRQHSPGPLESIKSPAATSMVISRGASPSPNTADWPSWARGKSAKPSQALLTRSQSISNKSVDSIDSLVYSAQDSLNTSRSALFGMKYADERRL
jgi:serine/threonine protein kinase